MGRSPHLCIWLLFLLLGPVCAQDLWVRNQPFTGHVQGSGSDMLVEMQTFLERLEIKAEDKGDVVIIGGFPIPVETSGNVRLVPLRDVVDAAGLRLSRNPALGTVDVRVASAGTGNRGNWSKASGASSSGSKRPSVKIGHESFRVRVPGHLFVLTAPEFLKSEEQENVQTAELNSPRAQAMGARNVFYAHTDKGHEAGYLTFSLFERTPQGVTAKKEPSIVKGLKAIIAELGGEHKGRDSILTVAGKRFHKFTYYQAQKDGTPTRNEAYFHISNKHRVGLLLVITAPKRQFNRVAPQLRLVLRNIRMK